MTSFSTTDRDNDREPIFGLTDKDMTLTVTVEGCSITARADAALEDGASGALTKGANGECSYVLNAPIGPECEQGATLNVTVQALQEVKLTVALPGGRVTASVSFSGTTTSLDKTTDFEATINTSDAPPAGELTTTNTTNGEVKAEGTQGTLNVSSQFSTSSKWKQSITVGNALTDAKIVRKLPEKVITMACGSSQTLRGTSSVNLGLSATVLDADTADFTLKAEGHVRNQFSITSATFARSGVETAYGGSSAAQEVPTLIPGVQRLLADPPRSLGRRLSPLARAWIVALPGNQAAVPVQLSSSNPKVAKPSVSQVTIPADGTTVDFQVKERRAGLTEIEATFPSLGGISVSNSLRVSRLGNRSSVTRAGDGPVILVEGTSDSVTFSRRPYEDIVDEKVELNVTAPNGVQLGKDPVFGRSDVTAVLSVTGRAVGTGTITARPESGGRLRIPFQVVPVSSVSFDPREDMSLASGTTLPLSLVLSDDLPTDLSVTIASSSSGAVRVQSPSLTIPRGSKMGGYSIDAVGSGTATISISSNLGMADQYVVTVP